MKSAVLAVSLLACAPTIGALQITTTSATSTGERAIQAAAIAIDADRRYLSGQPAAAGDAGRAAFRAACLERQVDREMLLDQLHSRAQVHAFAWKDWYERHCVPLGLPDGTFVALAETGADASAAYLCPASAGAPPTRAYERSDEERLAQQQRDACEAAQ
jgi:hypothetical protein